MSKGFRSFFITFVLACVLFAYGATYIFDNYVDDFIVSLFGIAKSENSDVSEEFSQEISRPDQSTDESTDVSTDENFKGTSKGSLFILRNEAGEVDTVLVMRRKLETKELLLTMIPADTRLYVDGAYQKVRNLLKNRDLEFFKAKMEAIVGVNIDYYFMMDFEDFEPVLKEFDGYNFNVPYDMYLEQIVEVSGDGESSITDESIADESATPAPTENSQGGVIEIPDVSGGVDSGKIIIVDLKTGRVKLDADVFRQLTIFRKGDDEKEHTILMRDLFTSVFVQMFSESNAKELRKDIEKVLPLLDTNFTMQDYDDNVDAILGYSGYTKHVLDYPGTYKKMADGSIQFNAEVEKAILQYKNFR